MKLYPPMIEGTLPAFYGNVMPIPFMMNKGVSENEITGFNLKVKTVQTQRDIGTLEINLQENLEAWNKETNVLSFKIDKLEKSALNIGQFYKVQLAYKNEEGTGFYSTIGIIKYTAEPSLKLETKDQQIYVGTYTQAKDPTEKVYSYCFTLTDGNGEVIETTGEQIHNHANDISQNQSSNSYMINYDLEKGKTYTLEYKIKTVNNLIKYTRETVMYESSIPSTLVADLVCNVDREEGYVDIILSIKKTAVGQYYLLRSSSEDNFKTWNKVLNFELQRRSTDVNLWKDMTVKHGVKYKYAVQQYNNGGIRSNRLESEEIQADFEHAFLYDGERQLKIKFNPKVTSFKTALMETKVDTIGNKYPFIFRNGNVGYKEFPISGLISFLSDENKMFSLETEDFYDDEMSFQTDLTGNNIYTERDFKLKALDWLNNGQPKLFKSPTEGNYIVRLMNVSLSPMDQLGRMLHTFSCTAYEIAENTYKSLEKLNFINADISFADQLYYLTKVISEDQTTSQNTIPANKDIFEGREAATVVLENMLPGDKITFTLKTEDNTLENQTVYIGYTGRYEIPLEDGFKISNLQFSTNIKGLVQDPKKPRQITYGYYVSKFKDKFDMVLGMQTVAVPCRQFVGPYDDIKNGKDLIYEINTVKDTLDTILYMRFRLRDTNKKVYRNNNKYYFDKDFTQEVIIGETADIYQIYVGDRNTEEWLDGYWTAEDKGYKIYTKDNYLYEYRSRVYINNDASKPIQLDELLADKIDGVYTINNKDGRLENIWSITIGAGVIAEIGYTKKVVEYDVEDWIRKETKVLLEMAENQLYNGITGRDGTISYAELKQLHVAKDECYKLYCKELEEAIAKAEGGDEA